MKYLYKIEFSDEKNPQRLNKKRNEYDIKKLEKNYISIRNKMQIPTLVCARETNIIVRYTKNILNVCLFIKFPRTEFSIIEFARQFNPSRSIDFHVN